MQSIRYISIVLEQVPPPPPPPSQTSFSQFEKKKSFMTKGSSGVTGSLGHLRNEFFTQALDSYYYSLDMNASS